jgi:hypothetical protein
MSEVANKDLCVELSELSGWSETDFRWNRHNLPTGGWTDWSVFDGKPEGRSNSYYEEFPAYDADYLRGKLKYYDFTIVNLSSETLSLTSDSLDDPEAAILGGTLVNLLSEFAIELFKQGVLTKELA